MVGSNDLAEVYEDLLGFPRVKKSPSLTGLLKYLWERKDKYSLTFNIWDECLHEHSSSANKDLPRDQYDYERSVRERCMRLRDALEEYNAQSKHLWSLHLPDAIPSQGYQLSVISRRPDKGETFVFWGDHLSGERDVTVVYSEHLFFQSWNDRYSIAFYDCNEEHPTLALEQLKRLHPDAYSADLNVAFPFVSAGEIEARDLVVDWFARNAMVKVKSAVTRRRNDKELWNDSLICFGCSSGHRVIAEVLESNPNLDISLTEPWVVLDGKPSGQVVVKNPSEEEISRFAPFNPIVKEAECRLHFSPERGSVLVIVTRVPNPHSQSMVTIINTDFGRAIDQVVALLTDEIRMRGKEWPKIGREESKPFQLLYALNVKSLAVDYLIAKEIQPLAWREY